MARNAPRLSLPGKLVILNSIIQTGTRNANSHTIIFSLPTNHRTQIFPINYFSLNLNASIIAGLPFGSQRRPLLDAWPGRHRDAGAAPLLRHEIRHIQAGAGERSKILNLPHIPKNARTCIYKRTPSLLGGAITIEVQSVPNMDSR